MFDGASLVGVIAAAIHLSLLAYSASSEGSVPQLGALAIEDDDGVGIQEEIVQVKAADVVDRARPGQIFSRTCSGKCNSASPIPGLPCQCHSGCVKSGNCCPDYNELCNTCKNRCGGRFDSKASCQCNPSCHLSRDCCPDFGNVCKSLAQSQTTRQPSVQATSSVVKCENITLTNQTGEEVKKEVCKNKKKKHKRRRNRHKKKKNNVTEASAFTDDELLKLSDELLQLDAANPLATPVVNLQGQIRIGSQEDMASQPLFGPQAASQLVSSFTAKLLGEMYDNYNPDVRTSEPVTPQHLKEEKAFFDAVLATDSMKRVINLLVSRGLLSADTNTTRSTLKTLWFERYSRAPGSTGSSGFEHVFLGEIKNGEPSGFHSWLFFLKEEKSGTLDYLGYSRSAKLSSQASLVQLPLKWKGMYKPVNTVFIGTSPEVEMALCTLCFYARPEKKCPLSGAGFKFYIQTYPYTSRGKVHLGTAYPTFS